MQNYTAVMSREEILFADCMCLFCTSLEHFHLRLLQIMVFKASSIVFFEIARNSGGKCFSTLRNLPLKETRQTHQRYIHQWELNQEVLSSFSSNNSSVFDPSFLDSDFLASKSMLGSLGLKADAIFAVYLLLQVFPSSSELARSIPKVLEKYA